MPDERFAAQWRVRRAADFRRAYQRRARASDDSLVICGCENGLNYPRLGLSVSRKLGTAVVRNRWKRLLREAFRLGRSRLPAGVDLVVIPRPGAEPELRRLRASLEQLAGRVARRLARERR